jgi:hypothetical protein
VVPLGNGALNLMWCCCRTVLAPCQMSAVRSMCSVSRLCMLSFSSLWMSEILDTSAPKTLVCVGSGRCVVMKQNAEGLAVSLIWWFWWPDANSACSPCNHTVEIHPSPTQICNITQTARCPAKPKQVLPIQQFLNAQGWCALTAAVHMLCVRGPCAQSRLAPFVCTL